MGIQNASSKAGEAKSGSRAGHAAKKEKVSIAEKEIRKRQANLKLKQVTDKLQELRNQDERLKNKLKQLRKTYNDGANPQVKDELHKLKIEVDMSGDKLMKFENELKSATREVEEADEMDVDTDIKKEEEVPEENSLFVPPAPNLSSSPNINVTEPDGTRSSPISFHASSPSPSPSVDSEEEYLFTPQEARKNAGLQTDGKMVAWRKHGTSTRVIVAYGPRNSRKYLRSTLYQESNVLDEDAVQFGPGHRLGDEKLDRKYVRKPSEFKGILAVAFNGPVESLIPKEKVARRRGEATPRRDPYPVVEIKVRWNINGDVQDTWEVRTSISHLFPSFCDLYIYQAAVHGENQYNAWRAGERASEDRSPTPALVPQTPSTSPASSESRIKDETQPVNLMLVPQLPSSTTKASPMKQYLSEWCELKEIDPKSMDAQADAYFNLAWKLVKLQLNNTQ